MRSAILIFLILLTCYLSAFSQTPNKIRIACIGNSITYGARIDDREYNSYPAQLAVMLGENYDVRNFGKNGATLLQNGNIPYTDSEEYKNALEFNPDWVFIKLGTNDTKLENRVFLNNFEDDYKEFIRSFQNLPSRPQIVLLLPVPVFSTDTAGITSSVLEKQIIPKIRQVAYDTGVEVINLYNLFLDAPELLPDKVHPNVAGALRIAKRLAEVLKLGNGPGSGFVEKIGHETTPFNFHGFQGHDFIFNGRDAKLVVPKKVASGAPWIWRARFWGHEPQTDIALLERGFHVAYCDASELFGNKEALSIWNGFYRMLTKAGLSKKSAMEGMSRGGVYVYRWAARYPERVTAIYADAPVLDLKSWPGGKGKSKGSAKDWETFKNDFNLRTDAEAMAFRGNPINLAEKIVKARIPLLHVCGDADEVVPIDENTDLFEKSIKAAGGLIRVIRKAGVGHHPHSLLNPQAVVDFIVKSNGIK